jgi:hypothetical protein
MYNSVFLTFPEPLDLNDGINYAKFCFPFPIPETTYIISLSTNFLYCSTVAGLWWRKIELSCTVVVGMHGLVWDRFYNKARLEVESTWLNGNLTLDDKEFCLETEPKTNLLHRANKS